VPKDRGRLGTADVRSTNQLSHLHRLAVGQLLDQAFLPLGGFIRLGRADIPHPDQRYEV
jgi:hypothetical protein